MISHLSCNPLDVQQDLADMESGPMKDQTLANICIKSRDPSVEILSTETCFEPKTNCVGVLMSC